MLSISVVIVESCYFFLDSRILRILIYFSASSLDENSVIIFCPSVLGKEMGSPFFVTINLSFFLIRPKSLFILCLHLVGTSSSNGSIIHQYRRMSNKNLNVLQIFHIFPRKNYPTIIYCSINSTPIMIY